LFLISSPVGETKTISDLPPLWGVNCQIEKWKDISSYYKRKINSKIKTCLLTALCNSLQKKRAFLCNIRTEKEKKSTCQIQCLVVYPHHPENYTLGSGGTAEKIVGSTTTSH